MFFAERLRFLFQQRGFDVRRDQRGGRRAARFRRAAPYDARLRLEALQKVRASPDFEALAVVVQAREEPVARADAANPSRRLRPAVGAGRARAGATSYASRGDAIRAAAGRRDYLEAFRLASGFRAAVDRFFTEVFVMVEDADAARPAAVAGLAAPRADARPGRHLGDCSSSRTGALDRPVPSSLRHWSHDAMAKKTVQQVKGKRPR